MSISMGATDVIGGGGAGYGFGGFGGIAPIGLIGINTLFGQNNWNNGNNGFRDGIAGTTVLEQNVSELRKDVQGVNTTVEALGNEIAGSQFQQTMDSNNNFRNLDNRLCDSEKTQLQSAYAQSLQSFQNTQAIQTQLSAMQTANDLQFCSVKQQINADGDATRALITQNLIDDLRSQLTSERRGRDAREIEINVQNNATQTQNQLQAQQQQQTQYLASLFGNLSDQVNRANNSIVQVGNGLLAGAQDNNQANTKVNS